MDPVEITAGRLHLRPWQPGDAPEVAEACQDPEITRWTTVPFPYTDEVARAWVGEIAPGMWESGTAASFAVLDATTARLLASVGLQGIDDVGRAEVGYWCAPWARRQGVTTEAVGAVLRWGFAGLGLRRIAWEAEAGNEASRAVALRCGITMEGTRRQGMRARDGGLVDCWTGARLAGDPDPGAA